MIDNLLGISVLSDLQNLGNKIKAPGVLESHYAPSAKVFLTGVPKPGDGLIALASFKTPTGAIRLASPVDNTEYAQNLYQALRLADSKKIGRIFVIPPEGLDIAVAINDRLKRCAFKG